MRLMFTGVASGENCTMPKGTVAPGKTLPPLVVPTSGLTRDAGSGWLAKADGKARRVARSTGANQEVRAACMEVRVRHVGREVSRRAGTSGCRACRQLRCSDQVT